jgi:predicted deacylase
VKNMSDWRFDLVPAPPPGTKATGFVDWRDPVVAGWEFPYVAVNGAEAGPAALVIAGIHGSEYVSIDAAVRLGAALDPSAVRGQVLCLPLLNPAAFWERTAFVSPIDNLNPNRAFPGKPLGSFTERLAHRLTERAIRHADALVDLHGGDIPEALLAFTIYEQTGDSALDGRSRAMAEAFGMPAMLGQPPGNSPIAGTTYSTAARLGVAAVIAEDGGAGVYDADAAQRMLAGTENALRAVGVLPGGVRPMPAPTRYGRFVWVRTALAGFFKPSVRVGDVVAEGAMLGTIGDFFGRTVETVVAASAGRVLFLTISAAVKADGLICGIGAGAAA